MLLGKFVWKIKSENDYLLPFLIFGPHGLFTARPVHPPLPFPAQPSRRSRPSSRAQPSSRACARTRQPPTPRAQPLTARARLSAPSSPRAPRNRPARPHAATAPTPRRGSVPPLAPGRFKSAPSRLRPSLLPHSRFCVCHAPRKAATVAPRSPSSVDRPSARNSLLRATSVSISPLVSFAVLPSISPSSLFLVLLAS